MSWSNLLAFSSENFWILWCLLSLNDCGTGSQIRCLLCCNSLVSLSWFILNFGSVTNTLANLNNFDIFALLSCTGFTPFITLYKYISIPLTLILVYGLKPFWLHDTSISVAFNEFNVWLWWELYDTYLFLSLISIIYGLCSYYLLCMFSAYTLLCFAGLVLHCYSLKPLHNS